MRVFFVKISFFRRGETSECLKANGKLPVESERLMIWVITGRRTDAQSFRREGGIGSNSHCLLGSEFKSSKTSVSEAGWRILREGWGGGGGGIGVGGGSAVEDCEARRDCSVTRRDEILSEKNEQNVSVIEGDGMEEGSGEGDLR